MTVRQSVETCWVLNIHNVINVSTQPMYGMVQWRRQRASLGVGGGGGGSNPSIERGVHFLLLKLTMINN